MNYRWIHLNLTNDITVEVKVGYTSGETYEDLREKALNKLARTVYDESEGVDNVT